MRFSLAVFLFVEYSIVKCQVADFAFSFLPQNDQFLANVLTVADYQNYNTNDNDISQKLSQDNVSHLDINIADFSLNVSNPSNIHRRTGFHSVVITIVRNSYHKFYNLSQLNTSFTRSQQIGVHQSLQNSTHLSPRPSPPAGGMTYTYF